MQGSVSQKRQPCGRLWQACCRRSGGIGTITATSPHGDVGVGPGARRASQVAQLRCSSYVGELLVSFFMNFLPGNLVSLLEPPLSLFFQLSTSRQHVLSSVTRGERTKKSAFWLEGPQKEMAQPSPGPVPPQFGGNNTAVPCRPPHPQPCLGEGNAIPLPGCQYLGVQGSCAGLPGLLFCPLGSFLLFLLFQQGCPETSFLLLHAQVAYLLQGPRTHTQC